MYLLNVGVAAAETHFRENKHWRIYPRPGFRHTSQCVFHTGVDYFGSFMVKQNRSSVKRYGCIFTCMVSRAVLLEVLHSLSSDFFTSGLHRFVGRRGGVGHIYSDNTTNFVGANRILRETIKCWNQHQISEFLLQKEICYIKHVILRSPAWRAL